MLSCFENVAVKGIVSVIPQKELSLLDDEQLYNGDQRRIDRVIKSSGFLKRRVCDEDVTTSDLCCYAAEKLLERMDYNRLDIDALLFVSYTPDYLMPASSYVLHKKLGLAQKCICMDIPQACSGYVIGLFQASMLINSGCKKVLLLVGDTFSKFSDMFNDHTAPIFGDAGSATLIERTDDLMRSYYNVMSSGEHYDSLMCKNGGFRRIPKSDMFYQDGMFKYDAHMDGGKIFEFTINNVAPSVEELMAYSSVNINTLDYYLFHQANKYIIRNVAGQLNIDISKVPMETLSKYGNQCGGSIPCAICDQIADDVRRKNNRVLLAGFGVGLSVANAVIDLNQIYCSDVLLYEK